MKKPQILSKSELFNIKTCFLTLLILFSSCQKNDNDIKKNNRKFEREIEKIYKENGLVGDFIIAVVDENGLAYSYALNRDIIEGKKSYLNNNSPLYIASHTKSFTGTLLKILEAEKLVDLSKPVNNYIPELTYQGSLHAEKVTIKNLLNHTHGFSSPRITWKTAYLGYSGENSELINDLNKYFEYDSLRNFRYSNIGPIIAAIVSEKVTGNSWKDEMKKQIFDPLKMKNTSAYVSEFDLGKILPSVTVSNKNKIIESEFYKNDGTMHASGGIISTINDLSKWLVSNIKQDETLLNKEDWKEMHNLLSVQDRKYFTYNRIGYSLGWDIAKYQNETIITRFGGLGRISFHASIMPSKKIGVIAFSNENRANLLPHIAANYAYNLINQSVSADSILNSEKEIFSDYFEKNNAIVYPNDSLALHGNLIHDEMIGTYVNDLNWPKIIITKKENDYMFIWGNLDGKIYKTEKHSYESNLGVLKRNFSINSDSLKTGSLIYKKIK